MIKNKNGWIKVVEAFTAVLLIGGVIILILNQNNAEDKGDISSKIYSDEKAMLRSVELDSALRASVLGINDASLPLSMNDSGFPQNVKAKIEEKNPGYLTCDAKICKIGQECVITNAAATEVYSTYTVIFANLQIYNPRKIVLSCVLIE